MTQSIGHRIKNNTRIGGDLRRRLQQRHSIGTHARKTLDRMSDQELVEIFLRHEQHGREHVAKREKQC